LIRIRRTAVATTLLLAAFAAAGCGLGPGDELGEVSLTVTRDYGREPLLESRRDGVDESDTVMRVLDRHAEVETRYGGGFVQAIDGLEAEEEVGAGPRDWFFYVNGVESTVGAADYALRGGEAIWWDYRDWSAAMRVPAVVGSWPQPFAGGYDGSRRPVAVECMGGGRACRVVRERLSEAGVRSARGPAEGAIRILVGPWALLRDDPAAAQIEDGPQASGVFADFAPEGGGFVLEGIDRRGRPARRFGPRAGLVAATRRYEAPPVWVVTGVSGRGVSAAARLLDAPHLRDRYAVAAENGVEAPLPVR
jgi:hypothetical protein